MKISIIVVLILTVIIGGYFLFRGKGTSPGTSLQGTSLNPTSAPSGSLTPEPSPTPTPILSDVIKATIVTARGNIEFELYPKIAPNTVNSFVNLAQKGFFDGTKFHRVVPDFVIQGGDPLSKTNDPKVGTGGPGYTFDDEINPKAQGLTDSQITGLIAQGYKYNMTLQSLPVKIGVLAMANSGPNTNGSQFFIVTTKDQPELNGKYTVFGKVVKGMDVARKIVQGDLVSKITIAAK